MSSPLNPHVAKPVIGLATPGRPVGLTRSLLLPHSAPAIRFFALRDGEYVGGSHRIPALAVAQFPHGVLMTKVYFLLQCSKVFSALHNDPATAISRRLERRGITGKDLIL